MNLTNNLIKNCICGNSVSFTESSHNGVELLTCDDCNVTHQLLTNFSQQDLDDFYSKQYHLDFQKKKNFIPYQERYDHDRKVAKLRFEQYKEFLQPGMNGLDIGSSNGAFVDEVISNGLQCIGLEPGENIGNPDLTIHGSLENTKLDHRAYDFVTMHDSIEHMINPYWAIGKVYDILKVNGIAIIDLPDFYIPEGDHHWKTIEHLWYFKESEFVRLLTTNSFTVEKITKPIPGKIVFYARVIK
jgi:2-polyprenyl-3-methyl-5-hydroxy-6-metoxy-1,4-benzoquinol methylase